MTKGLSEPANHLIDIAHKNSERLILLINDMLDIAKIACGQMHFDLKEEGLALLLSGSVSCPRAGESSGPPLPRQRG
jgi:signal transduction histidine kinase